MRIASLYLGYFIIYGYIFLLFLKGYYPANETGILFIGFMIFMSLAYSFIGSMLADELDNKRKEIYNRFEGLLEQNYYSLWILRDMYNTISHYDGNIMQISLVYPNLVKNNIKDNLNENFIANVNYFINSKLDAVLKAQLGVEKDIMAISKLISIQQLIHKQQHD